MKKFIKYLLILILILISLLFYNFFFQKKTNTQKITFKDNSLEKNENDIIRNLEYSINLSGKKKYYITADTGILSYDNNSEIIKMNNVMAEIIYSDGTSIKITSNKADYNNANYNSLFRENVKISYFDNLINADKMSLNFLDNKIIIYENVKYTGTYGELNTDNIDIDLLKREIQLYMNSNKNYVEMISK